ncbi:RHS repeat-associated core domain-containing protein [Pseudoduganella armeniaca]|uniref:RHS repeat-associated core domain-containing protein n=1 Tax=Pseudoduganella armeniaca TaxID=2072590 RepID=UPI0011B1EB0A
MHYNRFRYYDPDTGRFASHDPLGLVGGANTYSYTSNPVGWVDPLELTPCRKTGEIAGGVDERRFKTGEDVLHFQKHGSEIAHALGYQKYTVSQYVEDANAVLRTGTFVPELNAYVAIPGGTGSAKGLLVGLDRATGEITTMHMKPVSWFEAKAPSLKWEAQPRNVRTDTIGASPEVGWKWPY